MESLAAAGAAGARRGHGRRSRRAAAGQRQATTSATPRTMARVRISDRAGAPQRRDGVDRVAQLGEDRVGVRAQRRDRVHPRRRRARCRAAAARRSAPAGESTLVQRPRAASCGWRHTSAMVLTCAWAMPRRRGARRPRRQAAPRTPPRSAAAARRALRGAGRWLRYRCPARAPGAQHLGRRTPPTRARSAARASPLGAVARGERAVGKIVAALGPAARRRARAVERGERIADPLDSASSIDVDPAAAALRVRARAARRARSNRRTCPRRYRPSNARLRWRAASVPVTASEPGLTLDQAGRRPCLSR